ncbi:hypothetical protein C0Q70_19518 [Pomacea canaliculata]|uniref:Uncharacterized protein n=1 Tax=Pomacea canaliculata TaxID=400727 RepID=A0A2T7NJK1_POMCA|nr:hypothetical protein C0Q70_19518 [Pomacea canaliculata]
MTESNASTKNCVIDSIRKQMTNSMKVEGEEEEEEDVVEEEEEEGGVLRREAETGEGRVRCLMVGLQTEMSKWRVGRYGDTRQRKKETEVSQDEKDMPVLVDEEVEDLKKKKKTEVIEKKDMKEDPAMATAAAEKEDSEVTKKVEEVEERDWE